MRLLASGDHHFHQRSPRWNECLRIHEWIAERVEAEKPSVFCSAGDLYETNSTPKERAAVADWVLRIAEVCPFVICRGNHDRLLDLDILRRLRGKRDIIVEERAGVHVAGGIAIAAMAWPSRASLATMLASHAQQDMAEGLALHAVLRGLGVELAKHDMPRVLLMHAMVDGSKTSHGQPLIGQPLRVPLDALALTGADIAILGHIHKPQSWAFETGLVDRPQMPIVYTGSPFRTAFGEVEEKSIVEVTFADDAARTMRWGRVPTPCQQMVLMEHEWEKGGGWVDESVPEFEAGDGGLEVRFRYRVAADQRDAARLAANELADEMLGLGAERVLIEEEVKPRVEARAPEIARAGTLEEKLTLLWETDSRFDVDEDRRNRLLNKLRGLS